MLNDERIISIAGVKKGDLVYCLARLFATSTEPVLCIDNSPQHDLYRALPKVAGEHGVRIRNLMFVTEIAYSEDAMDRFSRVIVYHGLSVDETWWNVSGHRFLLINSDRFDMKDLASTTKHLQDENIRLYPTGMVSRKPTVSDIYESLGFNPKNTAALNEFPIVQADMAYYETFLNNGVARIKNATPTMKSILEDMYYSVVEKQKKDNFKKLIAKADK